MLGAYTFFLEINLGEHFFNKGTLPVVVYMLWHAFFHSVELSGVSS